MTLLIPQKRQSLCHRNLKYPLKVKISKRRWAKLLMMVRNCLSVGVKWIDFPVGLSVHFATNQGVKGEAGKKRQFWTIWKLFLRLAQLIQNQAGSLTDYQSCKERDLLTNTFFDKQRNIIQPYVRFCERACIQFFLFFLELSI